MIPDINLLPKREKKTAKGSFVMIGFAILFIGALAFISGQYILLTKNIGTLEVDRTDLMRQKEELTEQLETLRALEDDELETSVQFIEDISYPVSPLIVELNRYLDDRAYLRNYSFREDILSFSVDFETITDVSTYVDDLLKSPYVKDVIVNGMSSFDPVALEGNQFDVIDRFANTFELLIDLDYLRKVGGEDV